LERLARGRLRKFPGVKRRAETDDTLQLTLRPIVGTGGRGTLLRIGGVRA
jgi:hypothetical protein